MPQLYTELNGAINWNWTADQIDKFVRAFGQPFPGAFTFYEGEKINIVSGHPETSDSQLHPFYYGRIIGKNENGETKIVTSKGLFVVTKATFENKEYSLKKLKVSRILHTPINILENAKVETKRSLEMTLHRTPEK